jgi:monoamine oxidase
MNKREKCKLQMLNFFGPASASLVDDMEEAEMVEKCRHKISAILGEEKAKEFERYVNS